MKYKDGFEPCELFCPKKLRWTPLTNKLKKLLDDQGATALTVRNDAIVRFLLSFLAHSFNVGGGLSKF